MLGSSISRLQPFPFLPRISFVCEVDTYIHTYIHQFLVFDIRPATYPISERSHRTATRDRQRIYYAANFARGVLYP